MPKTQAKRGLSPRELDALRRRYLAEDKQAASERKWQLANDIASGINDIVGRGVIAPIAGGLGDVNQALWDAGAWVNNKIKDVEVATGMVKQPRYVQPTQGNAYLGSEDIGNRMEQAGLVSSERRPMTELAASLISPSAAAKTAINAPKTAMNMLRMVENLEAPSRGVRNAQGMYIPRGQMGAIDVYHGSPNEFDQFRAMDKIGSGQGGQSFGVGGYHASNKGVASEPQYTGQDGYVYKNQLRWPDAAREAKDPLDTKHFIDWDKPFDEQSDYVKSVISNLNEDEWYRVLDNLGEDGDWSTGRNIYDMARLQFDTKAEASKKLYEAGIAGNVFNDADTINRLGTNTPNYVTFSDELVDVVERNGQPIVKPGAPQANPQAGRTSIIDQKSVDELFAPGMSIRKIADTGFDPRFDPRKKEQQRLNALTLGVEKLPMQEAKPVSLVDYEGYPFITSMSDRTAAGERLLRINDVDLATPVNQRGGQDFMRENPGLVWASGKNPSNQIVKMAKQAKSITGKDPLYVPWRMTPTGGDFYTGTGETMLSYAASAMDKKTKAALDKSIKQFIPDWAGVGTEKGTLQFIGAKDQVRKKIKNMMDKEFRDKGGLSIGEARLAVSDPTQLNAQTGGLMNVGRIFADEKVVPNSGHPSYPFGVPGEGLGRLDKEIGVYQMLQDAVRNRGIADPTNPSQRDIRALQMKPYFGIITEDLLKSLGY